VSKKYRKPIVPSSVGRVSLSAGPADLLREAVQHLRRGAYAAAQQQVARVLTFRLDPGLLAAAQNLLAEAHFRAAVTSDDLSERLRHLDAALEQTPAAAKLHFQRGIVLWQLGRPAEAAAELNTTAATEPTRRGLAYLRALAAIATDQPWDTAGLTPAEANTVTLVARLVQRKPRAGSTTFAQPLLGKGTDLWQALIAMREDSTAAPVSQLKTAVEHNARKPVGRILNYYKGVAALRGGDRETARDAWLVAQGAGLATPALTENLTALMREAIVGLAQEGRWQDVVNRLTRLPDPGADRIVAETGSLAYYHLGYAAAQAGKWPVAAQYWRKANEFDASRYVSQNLALAEEALENWANAAEAWREMVRRRPRKEDHPDYLTDVQVAALWNHAAECYERIEQGAEVETCLRNAIKYAPDDASLRMRLADVLLDEGRGDAAETQLTAIVAAEPQNTEALVRLGRLYETWWDRDPMAVWRQVLAVNPAQPEAREALADDYIKVIGAEEPFANYRLSFAFPGKSPIEVLQIGLQELPGHPKLLVALGTAQARANQPQPARASLLQAFHAAPQDVRIANVVLHELLHVDAGDAIEDLVPIVRQIPRLLPAFWFDQATMVLQCKLDEDWAAFFFEEALKSGDQPWVEDTRAGLLLEAFEIAQEAKTAALSAALEKRIRAEVPASGAVQYLEACRLNFEKADARGALRLIREAIRTARKANDAGVVRRAEAIEPLLKGTPMGFDLQRALRNLFPEGV
jgi:tetratricopeptide (TPR) repeat protein